MAEVQKEILIHQLSPERFEDLQKLFYRVFGIRHGIEYLSKKYDTPYSNVSAIGHLAYHNMEPVAFTGLLPTPFHMNGRTFLGFQLCDYMTQSDFRKMGIQSRIWQQNENLAKSYSADFLFSFYQGTGTYNKAWDLVDIMHAYVIPMKNHIMRSFMNKAMPAPHNAPNIFLNHPGKQFTLFDEQIPQFVNDDVMRVDYNSAFLKCKTFTSSRRYISEDTYFWLKSRNVLEVGMIDSPNKNSIRTSLNAIFQLTENSRCSKIIFQVMPNSVLDKILAERHNSVEGFHVIKKVLNPNLKFNKLHLNFCDIDTF